MLVVADSMWSLSLTHRLYAHVCTCVQPVYPGGVVQPCALVDAMVECSLPGEVVEATARMLVLNHPLSVRAGLWSRILWCCSL